MQKQQGVVHESIGHAREEATRRQELARGRQTYGILDSRAINNIPQIGRSKVNFRNWNDRMVNAFEQVRRGTRPAFKAMMEHADQESLGGNLKTSLQRPL